MQHTLLVVDPLWLEGLLVLTLFNTLPTKADVTRADSSLFSAVKQRKGIATSGLPLKLRGQLCAQTRKYMTQSEDRKKLFCSNSNLDFVFGEIFSLCANCCHVLSRIFSSVLSCLFCTALMAFPVCTDYQVFLLSITNNLS